MSSIYVGDPSEGGRKILRGRAVEKKVRKCRVTIWRNVRAGHFPAPIELGPNSIGWFEDEIDDWLAARRRRTYAAPKEAV